MNNANVIRMAYEKTSGKISVSPHKVTLDLAKKILNKAKLSSGGLGSVDILMLDANSMYDRHLADRGTQINEASFNLIEIAPDSDGAASFTNGPCEIHGTGEKTKTVGIQTLIARASGNLLYICKNIAFAESVNSMFKKNDSIYFLKRIRHLFKTAYLTHLSLNLQMKITRFLNFICNSRLLTMALCFGANVTDARAQNKKMLYQVKAEIRKVRAVQEIEACMAGACETDQEKMHTAEWHDWNTVVSIAGVWIESVKSLSLLLHSLTNDDFEASLNSHIADLKRSNSSPTPMTLVRFTEFYKAKKENEKSAGNAYAHFKKIKNFIKSKFEKMDNNSFVSTKSRERENVFIQVLTSKNGAINAAFDQALIDKAISTLIGIAKQYEMNSSVLVLVTRDDALCDPSIMDYISRYAGIPDVGGSNPKLFTDDSETKNHSCITFENQLLTRISTQTINICNIEAARREQLMLKNDDFNRLILKDLSQLPEIHRCNLELLKKMRDESFSGCSEIERKKLLVKNKIDFDDAITHFNQKINELSETLEYLFQLTITQPTQPTP